MARDYYSPRTRRPVAARLVDGLTRRQWARLPTWRAYAAADHWKTQICGRAPVQRDVHEVRLSPSAAGPVHSANLIAPDPWRLALHPAPLPGFNVAPDRPLLA